MRRLSTLSAEEFNARYPVGTAVTFYPLRDNRGTLKGEPRASRTRSAAWTLGGGEPVVLIEGKAGGVSLAHLVMAPEEGVGA